MSVFAVDSSDPTGTTFVESPAGPAQLVIKSKTGTVIFDQTNTSITDSNGNAVTGTAFPSPAQFKLSLTAGNTYKFVAAYICLPPNSTGVLAEDAQGGIVFEGILPSTNSQIFTLKA